MLTMAKGKKYTQQTVKKQAKTCNFQEEEEATERCKSLL